MSKKLKGDFLPTGIGSLPFTDPKQACDFVLEKLPEYPFWPQLPKRGQKESLYIQYSEGLPGIVKEDDRIYFKSAEKVMPEIEKFYECVLSDTLDCFAISGDFAAGLSEMLRRKDSLGNVLALKCQTTGPITFGLQVTDENRKPLFYDATLKDIAIKACILKSKWQLEQFKNSTPAQFVFFDEPYLSAVGSAHISLDRDDVVDIFTEVTSSLGDVPTGMHCCGNTDWAMALSLPIDILNFDTFTYGDRFALFPNEIAKFLDRGGIIAWGIVPYSKSDLSTLSPDKLTEKLKDIIGKLVKAGISPEKIIRSSLVTPSCGIGTEDAKTANDVFDTLRAISDNLRKEYSLEK